MAGVCAKIASGSVGSCLGGEGGGGGGVNTMSTGLGGNRQGDMHQTVHKCACETIHLVFYGMGQVGMAAGVTSLCRELEGGHVLHLVKELLVLVVVFLIESMVP